MTKQNLTILLILVYSTFGLSLQSQTFTNIATSLSTGISDVVTVEDSFGTGASIADFDNDGDLDFFIGTDFEQANQLYRNNGNGQFTDEAVTLGITSTYRNRAALWFDYDGDQLLDLLLLGDCLGVPASVCSNRMNIILYKQNTDHTFVEVTDSGLSFGTRYTVPNVSDALVGGIAAGDINNDGRLDIIITVWGRDGAGALASLFLSNPDNTFQDISVSSGIGLNSVSRYQPVFHDFNQDGFMDIYVNVDFGKNEFWLNKGDTTFDNIAESIGADSSFNEMGMTVGDYDNDGDIDVYSTNISRIENGILRHNILLRNDWSETTNNLQFTEVANSVGTNLQNAVGASGWDWGTTFFDANNNGYIDLATTNGWAGDSNWSDDPSKLWQNIDGELFTDISNQSGFNDTLSAASLLAFDMDRDGDLDLLQTIKSYGTQIKPIRLLQNDIASSTAIPNNYLVIKPRMIGNNHFAIGAIVKITYGSPTKTAMRLITAGISYYGQEPAEAFFGLADNAIVNSVTIEWPDNTETVVQNIAANQVLTVDNSVLLNVENNTIENVKIYPNPSDGILTIEALNKIQNIEIYNILGQKVFSHIANSKNERINISALKIGSYFLKLTTENNQSSQTFQIIKK